MISYWPKGGQGGKYLRGVRRLFRGTISILKLILMWDRGSLEIFVRYKCLGGSSIQEGVEVWHLE